MRTSDLADDFDSGSVRERGKFLRRLYEERSLRARMRRQFQREAFAVCRDESRIHNAALQNCGNVIRNRKRRSLGERPRRDQADSSEREGADQRGPEGCFGKPEREQSKKKKRGCG